VLYSALNLELWIRDFHCFETDLNRISDLIGRFLMISAWILNDGMLSDIIVKVMKRRDELLLNRLYMYI
jgi:hypothetical protein